MRQSADERRCHINDRARELDPLSAVVNMDVAWVYFFAGRHENAIAAGRRTLELKPGYMAACYVWLEAAGQLGRTRESYKAAAAMLEAAATQLTET